MKQIKNNVNSFNNDVLNNDGYLYTTNAKYSSVVSNKRMSDEVFKLINSSIKTIIDIGCGDGTYTSEIKNKFPNINITGIDPSDNAIETAKKKYPNITFLNKNIYDLESLKTQKYDLCIIRGVLHHISNQSLAIKNVKQISNEMIIIEPNGNNFILKYIEKTSKYHIEHEEQSFSSKKLVNFCISNNWNIISKSYIGFVPFFFPTIPSKLIHFIQPLLERIPVLNKYFSAQIVLHCTQFK